MRQRDEPRHGLADAGDVSVLNASPERLAASGVHLQPGETLERAPGAPVPQGDAEDDRAGCTARADDPSRQLARQAPVSGLLAPERAGAATPVASSRMENVRRARAFIAAAVYGFSGEA